ncbi:MAG: rhodanese-like domain-containing protein [Candidatus Ventricola sp.]
MRKMRRGAFAAVLALVLVLALCRPAGVRAQCSLIVSPQELAQLLDEQPEALYVDLRSEKAYNQMHIPGFSLLEYDEQDVLALADEEGPVVFICATGVRSAMAFNLLTAQGRDDVHACIFGVIDFAEAMGETQMEGDYVCLPCALEMKEEEE